MGVTYDAGALIAAERNDRRMWALHAGYLAEEVLPTVPANVLAQAWRGGSSQVNLARMLRPCSIESMDEDRARRVGRLLGAARTSDVVDAVVVEGAAARGDAVVTSDPDDLAVLVAATGRSLHLEIA